MSDASNKETVEIFQKVTAMGNVTTDMIRKAFNPDTTEVKYVYDGGDIMVLYQTEGNYYGLGHVKHLTVSFGEFCPEGYGDDEEDGEPKPAWMMNHSQYFSPGEVDKAIECFVARLKDENRMYAYRQIPGDKLETIKIKQTGHIIHDSHYDYLDEMLNPFWKQVFGKTADEMFCGGMVSAHGDKCYSYRYKWADEGIDYQHGSLLFLLSYTSELGDRPKSETCEWIIENYHRYYMKILRAEQEVLKQVYGVDSEIPIEITAREEETSHGQPKSKVYSLYAQNLPYCMTPRSKLYSCPTQQDAVKFFLASTKKERVLHAKTLMEARTRR